MLKIFENGISPQDAFREAQESFLFEGQPSPILKATLGDPIPAPPKCSEDEIDELVQYNKISEEKAYYVDMGVVAYRKTVPLIKVKPNTAKWRLMFVITDKLHKPFLPLSEHAFFKKAEATNVVIEKFLKKGNYNVQIEEIMVRYPFNHKENESVVKTYTPQYTIVSTPRITQREIKKGGIVQPLHKYCFIMKD